jgi:hypothetical protein
LYFPFSNNYKKFTGARLNHQEHSAATKTQKAVKDRSQKFKQNDNYQIFQEFYGSG